MPKLPLEGIRVLDFTQARMGPQLTQWLAVMGAEVIKVETRLRPEFSRRTPAHKVSNRVGYFAALNYSKKSVTINMKQPKAVELVKELVKISDVVTENFGSDVMEHWGLGYADLKTLKPDIIVYAGSGFGRTGPFKSIAAYSPIVDAFTGLTYANGFIDGEPAEAGVGGWSDSISGQHGVFAILAALYHRSNTGEGQYIDLSMAEMGIAFSPEHILDYAINGRLNERMGNRDNIMAPHGCYRCSGKDNWVAIAVSNDAEWRAFCNALGNPVWTESEQFKDQLSRWKNQDELDRLVEQWTVTRDHYEVMYTLQKAGVMAAASANMAEVVNDPHLKERGFLIDLEYPDQTKLRRQSLPWKVSGLPQGNYQYCPALGEHNDYVFGELLGISQEEIRRLEADQVLY